MIQFRIKELCVLRGIKFPLRTLKRAGISHSLAHDYLHNERKNITLKHIKIFCTVFNCAPSDLFIWLPEDPKEDTPTNPLQAIRQKAMPDLQSWFNKLSVEEADQLAKQIQEKNK